MRMLPMTRIHSGNQGNSQQRARYDSRGAWQAATNGKLGQEVRFSIGVSVTENRMAEVKKGEV